MMEQTPGWGCGHWSLIEALVTFCHNTKGPHEKKKTVKGLGLVSQGCISRQDTNIYIYFFVVFFCCHVEQGHMTFGKRRPQ